jgi:hypothetical protein
MRPYSGCTESPRYAARLRARLCPIADGSADGSSPHVRTSRDGRDRTQRARLHRTPRRDPHRPRLPRRLPPGPRRSLRWPGSRIAAGPTPLRPAARRRIHLAQRRRRTTAGSRLGRAQRPRPAAGLRQVHLRPARRSQAAHPRSSPAGRSHRPASPEIVMILGTYSAQPAAHDHPAPHAAA